MIQAACPNCGNAIPFHSEFSTHGVCAYCDSLVVRRDSGVENLGKVAEIQQDGSPLQLGANGQYGGKNFLIIGRIQLGFGDGYWNEWHLLYSNGESGWLGEAMGEYFVSFVKEAGGLPSQTQIALGDALALDGENFVVTGSTDNRVSAYEGELPFIVDQKQSFATYDLRSVSGKAATIDYSDQPPTLFMGEYLPFQAFQFTGLRQVGQPPDPSTGMRVPVQAGGVEKFNCPTCGAPHSVQGGVNSKLLVCEYCGSAVDISGSTVQVIWQEERLRAELQGGSELPIGSVARIEGLDFKLIGYLKKSVTFEGVKYPWVEYLLYHFTNGYRWLVESDGHYSLMSPMAELPRFSNGAPVGRPGTDKVIYQGRDYRHFQTSTARTDALAGEFYWRVKIGDQAANFDYVCPPHSLSMEASEDGFVWSKGEYKTQEEIRQMFGLQKTLRSAVGVAPSQPNPHLEPAQTTWRTFWAASLVGFLLLASGILSGSGGEIMSTGGQSYQTFRNNPPQVSEPFELKGHGNVAFDFFSALSERWLHVKAELVSVEDESKKFGPVGATLESFHGKGSNRKTVRMAGIPNGTYRLRWEVSSGTTSPQAEPANLATKSSNVTYSISLRRGARVWGWYFFMLILLLPLPIMITMKKSSFETRRWYSSDYG